MLLAQDPHFESHCPRSITVWMYVPPQFIYLISQSPKYNGYQEEGGTLGGELGHGSGPPVNEINVFINKNRESSPAVIPGEDTTRSLPPGRGRSLESDHARTPILDLQPPEPGATNISCL